MFASNVRALRQQLGWSQAELARRLTEAGLSLKAARVAAIEAPGPQERTVSLDQAAVFAVVLRTRLESLLSAESDMNADAHLRAAVATARRADVRAHEAVDEANSARYALWELQASTGTRTALVMLKIVIREEGEVPCTLDVTPRPAERDLGEGALVYPEDLAELTLGLACL